MSKRHARRITRNANPSKPRWRQVGRELQREVERLRVALFAEEERRKLADNRADSLERDNGLIHDRMRQHEEVSSAQLRELEARYNHLVQHVADGIAMQPPAPIIIESPAPRVSDPETAQVAS